MGNQFVCWAFILFVGPFFVSRCSPFEALLLGMKYGVMIGWPGFAMIDIKI
jgi:hypothetical protein